MRQLTQAGKIERNNRTQLNLRDSLYLIRDYNWLKLCIPLRLVLLFKFESETKL